MEVTKKKLDAAAEQNIISAPQANEFYEFLVAQAQDIPKFTFTHALYYLGGFIAIGAMTLFMNLGWESFGGAGIFFISVLYAAVGLKITSAFSVRRLAIPAGICATFVVCLTRLAIYGLQQWLGVWPDESVYRDFHRYIRWH